MKRTRKLKNFFLTWRGVARRTGVTGSEKLAVYLDILYCRIRFGCSFRDYAQYEFYKYKDVYRKQFITDHHVALIKKYSNPSGVCHDKYEDYLRLKDEIARPILRLPECGQEVFVDFLREQGRAVLKPCTGHAGDGLQMVEYTTDEAAAQLYRGVTSPTVCEGYVIQHSAIAALNPSSVNTIRIVTLLVDEQFTILSAALKMGGTANSVADNMHQSGIAASIHLDSGILCTLGRDYANKVYSHHPVTGTQIIGLQIPHWEQVKAMVRRAHYKMEDRPYIGWDIAITKSGPEIIEANTMPGHVTMQFFDQTPKGKPLFEAAKRHRHRKS